MLLRITATDSRTDSRKNLFTWIYGAQAGIARAKSDAIEFGVAEFLSDFRAEEAGEPRLTDFYCAPKWF